MRTFDAVIPHLKKNKAKYIWGFMVLVVVNICQLLMPLIIRSTINSFGEVGFQQRDILMPALYIVGLAIAMIFMRYWWRMLFIGTSYDLEKKLRDKYYSHLMRLSQNYFSFSKIGDLMALATNDLNAVRMLFGIGFIGAADIFLLSISSFLIMIYLDVQLTLIALIPMLFVPLCIRFFGRRLHSRFKVVQAKFASLSGMIQESISGIRIVKAFTQEETELKKMQVYSNDFVKENVKMAKLSGVFHPSMGVFISISMIVILVLGGRAVILGDITIGDFTAFFAYLGMMIWPMIAIGWVVDLYQRGSASMKRLNDIWDRVPEIADNEDTDHSITEIIGNIKIRDLSFKYQKPESKEQTEPTEITDTIVLNNISTSIESGKTLAICGRTGTGKSTFIDLLARVFEPPKNSIFIDGIDITTIPLTLLRESIVLVPQDIFLFSDTIANNIALGKPEASQEEIEIASKAAMIYDDIIEFENGFETVVGERGVTVSGGQKQRIAIARALLTNPVVLVLDDSLSAVDTKTEKEILNNFIELRKGKTNIIIAHRISAIQHADKIIVIDSGNISESGNHESLLASGGLYAELFEKQKIEERIGE